MAEMTRDAAIHAIGFALDTVAQAERDRAGRLIASQGRNADAENDKAQAVRVSAAETLIALFAPPRTGD